MPWRRSLFLRLLATSVLVALCAIAATAWLAVQSTTRAIRQENGQSLSDDTSVYDGLLSFAAQHRDWIGVETVRAELSRATGRQIIITTRSRQVIAGPPVTADRLPPRASAVIDPLNVDTLLASAGDQAGTSSGSIDARAAGPFRLTAGERRRLAGLTDRSVRCAESYGLQVRVINTPSGRPQVRPVSGNLSGQWADQQLDCLDPPAATPTEQKALSQLNRLVGPCVARRGLRPVEVTLGFSWLPVGRPALLDDDGKRAIQACIDAARRDQLRPHVAPPALLFMTSPDPESAPVFTLSRTTGLRIAGVSALVLAVAVGVTALVGRRLIRPLHALTAAASGPIDDIAPLPIVRDDEIGRLTAAFNGLSERRRTTEHQRRSMVSDIAHELRTPLTNIQSWLDAARDGLAAADDELLTLLGEEAALLRHVIDDLRDLAAADAGELRLHPEPLFVNDLLEQVAVAHRGAAEAARVHIATESMGDPEVLADPNRLRQAVGNLVNNAVRHSRPGAAVFLRSRLEGADLVLEVTDTGDGIDPAELGNIFERFWRADRSRSRHTGGSGLGLSIVRKIAEAHGGRVDVSSEPGRGSTFTLRVPVVAVG